MHTFKTVEEIRASVVSIGGTAGKLQDKIHRTGVSILMLWNKEQIDAVEAGQLLTELQQASPYHGNAFAKWVEVMTDLQWSKESKSWYGDVELKLMGKAFIAARDKPFYKVKPATVPTPFNLLVELRKMEEKATKRKNGKAKGTDKDDISGDALRALRTLIETVTATS